MMSWIPRTATPPAVHICWPQWDEAITQEPGQGLKHTGQNNRRHFQWVGLAQRRAWGPTGPPPPAWLYISEAPPHAVTLIPPVWEVGVLGYCPGQLLSEG